MRISKNIRIPRDLPRPVHSGLPLDPEAEDRRRLGTGARCHDPGEVRALRRLIDALPDVRIQRVDEIRQAIAAGRYRIDPEAIADRILEGLIRPRCD